MGQLIQIKNGNWIDPAFVTAIRVFDEAEPELGKTGLSPRVAIHYHGLTDVIEFPDMEAARAFADGLARRSNADRAEEMDVAEWPREFPRTEAEE
jgi:hypothetical protein